MRDLESRETLASLANQSRPLRVISQIGRFLRNRANEILHGEEVTYQILAQQAYSVTRYQIANHLYSGALDINTILGNVVKGIPTEEQLEKAQIMLSILVNEANGALIPQVVTVDDPELGQIPITLYTLKPDRPDQTNPTYTTSLQTLREIAQRGQPPVSLVAQSI